MNPGLLNKRITIQKLNSETSNANGFAQPEWVDYKKRWSAIGNSDGKKYYSAMAEQAEKTVEFTIRYLKELDSTLNEDEVKITNIFRIKFKNSIYDISFVDNEKYSNAFMVIKALEVG